MENATIRAVIFREGDLWVAQCLEYDIAAQGTSVTEAYRRLEMTLKMERVVTKERNGRELAGINAAPPFFHELYEKAGGAYLPAMAHDHMDAKLAA